MKPETVSALYVVSKTGNAGSMLVTLGLTEFLKRHYGSVAFFRPLLPDPAVPDNDIETVLGYFSLNQRYEEAAGIGLDHAVELISTGKITELISDLVERYSALHDRYDFVLCQGLADEALAQVIDFDINVEIAKNFSAPVVGVFPAKGRDEHAVREAIRLWNYAIEKQGAEPFMLLANRCERSLYDAYRNVQTFCPGIDVPVVLLPDVEALDRSNVAQIAEALNCERLVGTPEQMQRIIAEPRVAAMHLEHFLGHLRENDLVITPADRSDIILGAVAANYAVGFPAVGALLLTGDLDPAPDVLRLILGMEQTQIPLLHLRRETLDTVMAVRSLPARFSAGTPKKIATALGLFNRNVDTAALQRRLAAPHTELLTPVMFEHRLFEQAAAALKTIVLPESEDDRILQAADILLRRQAVRIMLIGTEEGLRQRAAALGLDLARAEVVRPDDDALKKRFAGTYYQLRRHKGITLDAAFDAMSNKTLFATMLVYEGMADGMVSGATHTTRETILPALETIKTRPGMRIVSSCFFMCFNTRVLLYADCAVNPDPDAAELAEIAIASAETARQFAIEPRIAMLSYSTGESGVGSDVEKVRQATALVRQLRPDLVVDGPIQYDAAIDPDVGAKKMPGSPVAGRATVFIFPDLNTGNNTYKAVQRSAGAVAVGPVMQGLNRPVNDLSRGCSVDDIVTTVAITAIQAQQGAS